MGSLSIRAFFFLGGVVLLLVIFGWVLGKPAIIGYSTYQQIQDTNSTVVGYVGHIEELKQELVATQGNLSAFVFLSERLFTDTQELHQNLTACLVAKESAEIELKHQQEEQEQQQQQLQQKFQQQENECSRVSREQEQELARLRENNSLERSQQQKIQEDLHQSYDLVVANAARRICCKEKVDSPSINYYAVFNDKIMCSGEGGQPLNCFSAGVQPAAITD